MMFFVKAFQKKETSVYRYFQHYYLQKVPSIIPAVVIAVVLRGTLVIQNNLKFNEDYMNI